MARRRGDWQQKRPVAGTRGTAFARARMPKMADGMSVPDLFLFHFQDDRPVTGLNLSVLFKYQKTNRKVPALNPEDPRPFPVPDLGHIVFIWGSSIARQLRAGRGISQGDFYDA
jgi:hypothetical protein